MSNHWLRPNRSRATPWLPVAGLLATCALAIQNAHSEDAVQPQELAIAAGYKAQFTCSATFNAGKTPAMIAAQELTHFGTHLQPAMALLGDAVVDSKQRTVSVGYSDGLPPRIAVWRAHLGCVSLPQGVAADFAKTLPKLRLRKPRGDSAAMPWPQGDRVPADAGTANLDPIFTQAFAGQFGGVTSAVLVTQGRRLLAERYADGYSIHTSQRTWSVAKSIAASVVGAAVHQRLLKLDAPTRLAAWQRDGDPRQAITLENLLHMASGLDNRPAGNRTDNVYFGGGLVAQYATKNPLNAQPGSLWSYANNDTMLAMRTLRERLNNDRRYLAFPFKALLHPIGMYHTNPETDWDGDFIMSSQVWTTARDLARLGLLYLNDGVWNDKRILPSGWSQYVATAAPAQPANRQGARAAAPGRGYGAQFWLYEHFPGVPAGTYAALGNRGQFVIIVPARDVVIVRRGYDYSGERFDGPGFTAAVLAALEP